MVSINNAPMLNPCRQRLQINYGTIRPKLITITRFYNNDVKLLPSGYVKLTLIPLNGDKVTHVKSTVTELYTHSHRLFTARSTCFCQQQITKSKIYAKSTVC